MSSKFRCPVPFYPDPGQPQTPSKRDKFYLVVGKNVIRPGAYNSWSSADAQYNKVSGATAKGYANWSVLESAWFAGCDRGEHDHPARPLQSTTSPTSMSSHRQPRCLHIANLDVFTSFH
ncbi:hypothetical protein C8R46DRAFT_1235906 [Mycena filopes]|nr:hypothetical protein C8R46DRAFT_1235906 [Mycena filopes]